MKKLLFIIIALLVIGCSKGKTSSCLGGSNEYKYDYSDVEHLKIKWEDILKQKEERYFAYIYSYTCGHCNQIKPFVIEKALVGDPIIYFISYTNDIPIISNPTLNEGKDKYEELGIGGTPSLFDISSGVVNGCYTGTKEIIETLTNRDNE